MPRAPRKPTRRAWRPDALVREHIAGASAPALPVTTKRGAGVRGRMPVRSPAIRNPRSALHCGLLPNFREHALRARNPCPLLWFAGPKRWGGGGGVEWVEAMPCCQRQDPSNELVLPRHAPAHAIYVDAMATPPLNQSRSREEGNHGVWAVSATITTVAATTFQQPRAETFQQPLAEMFHKPD